MSSKSPLTIVGLGPGDPEARTIAAQRTLDAAKRIVLRTAIHPGLDDLVADPRVVACDDLYETGASFEETYAAIAERVLDAVAASKGAVVYAVPGNPRFGERSVALVLAGAAERNIAVSVQPAVSAIDAIAVVVERDPLVEQVQIVDAADLSAIVDSSPFAGGRLSVDPTRPLLVTQVFNAEAAAATKLALGRFYPDDHAAIVVWSAGVPRDERAVPCRLFELDRQPVDHLSSVWVDPMPPLAALRSPATLQRIIARLRAPGGCPWDRAQTHASLRNAVIEEAYETVDAIDAGDAANLAEELGDLLLQVALHAQLAEEEGTFTLEDVYEQVSAKLVRRHPHVFGEAEALTPTDVVRTWESVKAAERASSPTPKRTENAYQRLPKSMPAFEKATALLGPRKGTVLTAADGTTPDAAGEAILMAIESAVAVGVDPDVALVGALRRRFGADELTVAANGHGGKETA